MIGNSKDTGFRLMICCELPNCVTVCEDMKHPFTGLQQLLGEEGPASETFWSGLALAVRLQLDQPSRLIFLLIIFYGLRLTL